MMSFCKEIDMFRKPIGDVTLPREPRSGLDVLRYCKDVQRCLQQLRDRVLPTGQAPKSRSSQIKPPLWVTLKSVPGDPVTWEIYAEYGHVVPRHNGSADTGAPITITDLPNEDATLAVSENDKLWVKQTISVLGKVTAAVFESGTAWPDDTPPSLIGGDDQTGTAGTRHIRIAEIIANPDSTSTPPGLISDQLHTGHIDHFQPELCENTITSASTDQGRVVKTWNASAGRWEFRYLEAGDGLTITEEADRILIEANSASHQWKVTENGDTTMDVAAGSVMSILGEASPGLSTVPAWTQWKEYDHYVGGTVTGITTDGVIYGEVDYSAGSETLFAADMTDGLQIDRVTPAGSGVVVAFAATIPESGSGVFYFEIAKVASTGTVATKTRQILEGPTPPLWLIDIPPEF